MANRARKVAMAVAMIGAVLAPRTGLAADTTLLADAEAHVRPTTPAVASLVAHAMRGSATFRQIVRTIEDSDTYVYVLEGDCGHGVRACFSGVTVAGPRRIMRVTVSLDPGTPDWYLMGSIGHEFFLYERIGFKGTSRSHETRAAMDAGNAVRAEIRKFDRSVRPE